MGVSWSGREQLMTTALRFRPLVPALLALCSFTPVLRADDIPQPPQPPVPGSVGELFTPSPQTPTDPPSPTPPVPPPPAPPAPVPVGVGAPSSPATSLSGHPLL